MAIKIRPPPCSFRDGTFCLLTGTNGHSDIGASVAVTGAAIGARRWGGGTALIVDHAVTSAGDVSTLIVSSRPQ